MDGRGGIPMSSRGIRQPPPMSARSRSVRPTSKPIGDQKTIPIPPAKVACNKCRRSLTLRAVVCNCSCLFCEPCAQRHFTQYDFCPCCKKKLGQHDTMLIDISKPIQNEAPNQPKINAYQMLFRLEAGESKELHYRGVCKKLFQQIDLVSHQTKFVVQQFLRDASRRNSNLVQLKKAYDKMKDQIQGNQQLLNSERQTYQQNAESQVAKLHTQDQTILELQQQLEEKEEMLRKFRARESSGRSLRSVDGSGSYQGNAGCNPGRPPRAIHHQQSQLAPHIVATHHIHPPTAPLQDMIKQREADQRRCQTHLQPASSQSQITAGYYDGGSVASDGRSQQAMTINSGGIRTNLGTGQSFHGEYHHGGSATASHGHATSYHPQNKRRRVSQSSTNGGRSHTSSRGHASHPQQRPSYSRPHGSSSYR